MFQIDSTHRSLRSSLFPLDRNRDPLQFPNNSNRPNLPDNVDFKLLERYHDQSYIVKQKNGNYITIIASIINKVSSLIRTISRRNNTNLTINPFSTILYAWNIIVAFFILYHLIEIPITIFFTEQVFESEFQSAFGITINILSLIILLINIVYVVPNTQYYHNGYLINDQIKIIKRYLNWRFATDAIGWIGLFVYVVAQLHIIIYLKVVFYLMIYRLWKIDQMLEKKIELTKYRLAIYKLLRLILFFLFVILWLSCIYFAIDYYYYQSGYNPQYLWLTSASVSGGLDLIQTYPWYIWLNYSMYWCIQTVTMVGFGDNTPRNTNEVIYCSICIMTSVLLYVFFVSDVWAIISEARQFTSYQKKQWKLFKEYQLESIKPLESSANNKERMKKFKEIKNKIGSYLFQMWNQEKLNNDANIVEILESSLTNELKNEIFINYRQNLFQSVILFGQLARTEVKNYQFIFRQIIFKIKQKKYAKGQSIMKSGQVPTHLSYLVNGKLILSYPNSNYSKSIFHKFNKKKIKNEFGDKDSNFNYAVRQFFIQQKIGYQVNTESFCKVSQLGYNDFIQSLKQIEQFYVKYCQLRDKLKIENYQYLTGESCFECESCDHKLQDCPNSDIFVYLKKTYFRLSRNSRKSNDNEKISMKRQSYKRKGTKSIKILNNGQQDFLKRNENIDGIKSYRNYNSNFNL